MQILSDWRAGPIGIKTPGLVGIQGVVTGMHGAGVGVPKAAAVAAMTAGFVGALHIPKGSMLTIGMQSAMLPTGNIQAKIGNLGKTTSFEGAIPKEHLQSAPQTATGISIS